MRFIIASVISVLFGALVFFALPGGGNLSELNWQGVVFGLFFGIITTLPFFLFCTLPTAFIVEGLTTKYWIRLRIRALLYILLTALFIIIYRFTLFYWMDFAESNLFAVFGYSLACSIAFCYIYTLLKRKRRIEPEPELEPEPKKTRGSRRYRGSH
ncbi:hypothetical protein [Fictibacillus phosphorivorans]|uniref:hypothetical protein n=1 Tax=Fictibacillus phosphorivorans TaxID=1221500 RepID=UPI00204162FA|nr:hypothetical protein [Fictibacillus phosphorivorans]MCM3719010.1 hypothetical protein [Fictibacillus phosphorivorans]MCM3776632.1 hypothetical protein [Fictibacillus phosphorivorans]